MKTKKFLSFLLSLLMMFLISSVAFADDEGWDIGCSGGSYIYTDADKKLSLDIYEEIYLFDEYPWDSYRDEIEEIEIIYGGDVLWMFDHVFENMAHVKTISLIKRYDNFTYITIPEYAFAGMPELETIIIRGKNEGRIDETAFKGCKNIKTVINESDLLVIPLDEDSKDNVMITCYNDSVQHQACIDEGISHITIDKDKICGHNSGNPLERIVGFIRNVIDSLRSFFERLFGR